MAIKKTCLYQELHETIAKVKSIAKILNTQADVYVFKKLITHNLTTDSLRLSYIMVKTTVSSKSSYEKIKHYVDKMISSNNYKKMSKYEWDKYTEKFND